MFRKRGSKLSKSKNFVDDVRQNQNPYRVLMMASVNKTLIRDLLTSTKPLYI